MRLIEDRQIGDSVLFTGNLESIDDFYKQCASVDLHDISLSYGCFTARSSLPPVIALGGTHNLGLTKSKAIWVFCS